MVNDECLMVNERCLMVNEIDLDNTIDELLKVLN
jgi:hypothetical protein